MVLDGLIVSRDVMRVSPGGVETLNLTLHHQSQQIQIKGAPVVAVELEMNAIAFGEIAAALNLLAINQHISVKGFLSQKNRYKTEPILHITQFKMLSES